MERKNLSTSALLTSTWVAALIFGGVGLSGCTSLFFQPSRDRYPYLELDRLSAKTVELRAPDQTKISAWLLSSTEARRQHPEIKSAPGLRADEVRGITLQFHGNAENMTSHYRFQLWLLFEGWDVLTFDYRGYGMSGGDPSNLRGVLSDSVVAVEWAQTEAKKRNLPLVIFGQSLGASLAIDALAELDSPSTSGALNESSVENLRLLVIDSAFYSFTSVAREKLSEVWFLWPFQWLGWVFVSDELSAHRRLKNVKPGALGSFATPAIFLHSENDPVVPSGQGLRLYEIYPGEKVRWTTREPGHVNTLFAEPSTDVPPKTFHRENLKKRLLEISKAWTTRASK